MISALTAQLANKKSVSSSTSVWQAVVWLLHYDEASTIYIADAGKCLIVKLYYYTILSFLKNIVKLQTEHY